MSAKIRTSIVLTIVTLVAGIAVGYFASSSIHQSQLITAQIQASLLQSQVSDLQGQITTLRDKVKSLLNENAILQFEKDRLESENRLLKQNITDLVDQLLQLRVALINQSGTVLSALSGGEEKTGPTFHIPKGEIKITVSVYSLGSREGISIFLYKVNASSSVCLLSTVLTGERTIDFDISEEGDYYLKVSNTPYVWMLIMQVYESK